MQQGTRILLVDDSLEVGLLYKIQLERAGACVALCHSAYDGLLKFTAFCPDMVLLDLSLPDASGYAVLESIRRQDAQVPVIALTGHSSERERDRCLDAGFDGFFEKGHEIHHLFSIIDHCLAARPR